MTLTEFEDPYFVGCPSVGIWLIFSSWFNEVYAKTSEVKCHRSCLVSRVQTINTTYGYWCRLRHLHKAVFVRFSHCEAGPPFPFQHWTLWKGAMMSSPPSKSRKFSPLSLSTECLHKFFEILLMGDLSILLHLLV